MPSARLLYNPNAGRFQSESITQTVSRQLQGRGWEVEIAATKSGSHITTLARAAASEGVDVVAVAGGDGSVGRAAAGLADSHTAMAVIPTGTANVWAQQLEIPVASSNSSAHAGRLSDLIANGNPAQVDVGVCNGTPFLLWAGIGLDAQVVHEAEHHRSHLKKLFAYPEYGLRAFKNAATWPGISVEGTACEAPEDQPVGFSGRFQLAIVTNIRLYAGGLVKLSPAAHLNDGRMDLWLFKGQGLLDAWRNALDLLRGRHPESRYSRRIPFSQLTLHLDRPTYLHADGDPLEKSDRVDIHVEQSSLKVLMPDRAYQALMA